MKEIKSVHSHHSLNSKWPFNNVMHRSKLADMMFHEVGRMDILLKIVGKRMVIQVIFHRIEEEEIELFMVMVEAQMLTKTAKCAITVVSLATLRQSASRNMDIHQDIVCTRRSVLISITQLHNQRIMRIQQQQLQFKKDKIQK